MAIKELGEWTKPVMVKVNDKEYPTQSYNGVQRFIPNRIVEYVVNQTSQAFFDDKDTLEADLNSIKIKVLRGDLPLQDYIEYLILLGYSVSGFCDAVYSTIELNDHIFLGETEDWFVIENPLWNEE